MLRYPRTTRKSSALKTAVWHAIAFNLNKRISLRFLIIVHRRSCLSGCRWCDDVKDLVVTQLTVIPIMSRKGISNYDDGNVLWHMTWSTSTRAGCRRRHRCVCVSVLRKRPDNTCYVTASTEKALTTHQTHPRIDDILRKATGLRLK